MMHALQTTMEKIHPDDRIREAVRQRVLKGDKKKPLGRGVLILSCAVCILLVVCLLPVLHKNKNKGVYFGQPAEGEIGNSVFGDAPAFMIYHGQYYMIGETYRTSSPEEKNVNTAIPYNENAALLVGEKLGTTDLHELDINQEGIYIQDIAYYTDLTSNVPGLDIYTVKGYSPDEVLMGVSSLQGTDVIFVQFWLPVQNGEGAQ